MSIDKKTMDAYEKSKADMEADKTSKYKEGSAKEQEEDDKQIEGESSDNSYSGKTAKGIKGAIHAKLSEGKASNQNSKGGKPNMLKLAKKLALRKVGK